MTWGSRGNVTARPAPAFPDHAPSTSCVRSPVASRSAVLARSSGRPVAVVTREKGKNDKLVALLEEAGIASVELPLIEHCDGEDRVRLPTVLRQEKFDYVAVTSPEAAHVFLDGWRKAGKPRLRVTVVGEGTGRELPAELGDNLQLAFTPSKANAVTLAAELPEADGGGGRVLYPSSSKASSDLQEGLAARGFTVVRLNTYSTRAASTVDPEALARAKSADVLTIGSPSAARAWLSVAGAHPPGMPVACIGSTSFEACLKLGFPKDLLFFPESPGLKAWAEVAALAVASKAHA